jgi:hypothetical protein
VHFCRFGPERIRNETESNIVHADFSSREVFADRFDRRGGATNATATPLTPFRNEAQAQRHCPGGTVVRLDFRKGIYYAKLQKRYARGFTGSFVCRDEARRSSYRRSLLGLR